MLNRKDAILSQQLKGKSKKEQEVMNKEQRVRSKD